MLHSDLNHTAADEDASLLREIERGCKSSFDRLFNKYWENSYNEAYKRLKDKDQAKDVVQEIFTHIWIKRETLQIENLPAYLNVAIRNKIFKLAAKQKLSHPFFDLFDNIEEARSSDGPLLTKEFLKSYDALVNTLPSKKQLIFRLRHHEDMSTKEIAQQLGLSRKTVQNQLSRAVELLKMSLFILLIMFSIFIII